MGILYYKDLLPVWEERRAAIRAGRPPRVFRVRRLMRKHLVVPETKPVSQMLAEFQQGRSHMAMVVDEFGTIVGLVTVEDVLEQIVGEIADEYDVKSERPVRKPTSWNSKARPRSATWRRSTELSCRATADSKRWPDFC